MLNDEICKLRDKLNKSIEQGDDYSVTYKLSVELDELIAKYYKESKKKDWNFFGHARKVSVLDFLGQVKKVLRLDFFGLSQKIFFKLNTWKNWKNII